MTQRPAVASGVVRVDGEANDLTAAGVVAFAEERDRVRPAVVGDGLVAEPVVRPALDGTHVHEPNVPAYATPNPRIAALAERR
jgi:hypothetical protein